MNWKNQVTTSYKEISKYSYIGLRSLCRDENYSIGDYARNSREWDFENDCSSDVEMNGTSAIMIDNNWIEDADDLIGKIESVLSDVAQYNGGDRIVLLGGNKSQIGDDSGERVITSAKVLAIIK